MQFPVEAATWLRKKDRDFFGKAFSEWPFLHLKDAHEEAVSFPVHGLLLTGGSDIGASFLSQENIDESRIEDPRPERDAWEFQAIREAIQRGIPVLAVCRGMQVLNVALGGTLRLHIEGHRDLKNVNEQPLQYLLPDTPFRFDRVNSNHHQCLDRVADPLEVEAIHAPDGVVEQVRIRNYPWGWGVQYHPERDPAYYRPIFEGFAQACAKQARLSGS